MQDPEQYESIITNHPAIINELKQINLDIQLAERYPRNFDNPLLILHLWYQNMNPINWRILPLYTAVVVVPAW